MIERSNLFKNECFAESLEPNAQSLLFEYFRTNGPCPAGTSRLAHGPS